MVLACFLFSLAESFGVKDIMTLGTRLAGCEKYVWERGWLVVRSTC